MHPSELRSLVERRLLDFVWNEWAQMGVLATPARESAWAADPEALLLLTLEVGRADARVLGEALDWLATNGDLVSQQRLRNLCVDEDEKEVANAALGWAAAHHPALRSARAARPESLPWLEFARSGKSQQPRLDRPINFAFRLRRIFGLGSRAEIVRFLLTSQVPGAQAEVVRRASGFSKRNVLQAANELAAAGAIEAYGFAGRGDRMYRVDVERWKAFLDLDVVPAQRDWPQLFRAMRLLHRWLGDPQLDELSEYLRASEARQLTRRIEDDLRYAAVDVSNARTGADYWQTFEENVDAALARLE